MRKICYHGDRSRKIVLRMIHLGVSVAACVLINVIALQKSEEHQRFVRCQLAFLSVVVLACCQRCHVVVCVL